MKTMPRRPFLSSIPGYEQNAVIQVIIASGIGFISYHLARIILLIVEARPELFPSIFTSNVALQPFHVFPSRFWTVLLYGWVHSGFWDLFSNMIWLYCFGSVVQMLVGYKQIIPIFIYSMIMGGLCYEFSQLIPGGFFAARPVVFGAYAAVMGLAVAALTIAPDYRYFFTPTFSVPLVVVACIFFGLMVLQSNIEGPMLFLMAGGAATGYFYIRLLKAGYRPGGWMYGMFNRLEDMATPNEYARNRQTPKRSQVLNKVKQTKHDNLQKRIDDILDKINQQGYDSLTKEEKDILMKAGKDDNT
jgi:membrane associated rhomboid family serine protease